MAAGDVYRVVIRGLMSGNEWVNALHFRELAAGPDLSNLAAGIKTTLYDELKALNTPDWSIEDITLSQLAVGGGIQLVETYGEAGTGSSTTGQGALTNAFVGSLRSTLAGRSHRGRVYLAVDRADAVQSGKWATSGFYTPINAALQALLAIYGDAGSDTHYEWIIWSRKLGETVVGGRVTAYDFAAGSFPVHAVVSDPIARVQRRREFGKGA